MFFLILSATFAVSDNNSYSKYSVKSFFSCYFEKMNDFKHAFGTSSLIKNSGSIVGI